MTESTPEWVADWLRQEVRNTVHINGKDVQWPWAIPLGSEYIQHGEFFFTERWVWKYTMSGWTSLTEFMGRNCLSVRELNWTPAFIIKNVVELEQFRRTGHMWARWCGPYYMVHNTILTADGEIVPRKISFEVDYEGDPLTRTIYPHRDILALWNFNLGWYVKKLSEAIQQKLQDIFTSPESSDELSGADLSLAW